MEGTWEVKIKAKSWSKQGLKYAYPFSTGPLVSMKMIFSNNVAK